MQLTVCWGVAVTQTSRLVTSSLAPTARVAVLVALQHAMILLEAPTTPLGAHAAALQATHTMVTEWVASVSCYNCQ